jgi:hypothetical protein
LRRIAGEKAGGSFFQIVRDSDDLVWQSWGVQETETIQGRRISGVEIAQIRELIEKNPQWSRWRVSQALAHSWQWHAASGQLKDMAARTLLLKLHERGLIRLPERRRTPVARRSDPGPDLFECVPPAPVVANLSALRPLQIQVVGPRMRSIDASRVTCANIITWAIGDRWVRTWPI